MVFYSLKYLLKLLKVTNKLLGMFIPPFLILNKLSFELIEDGFIKYLLNVDAKTGTVGLYPIL